MNRVRKNNIEDLEHYGERTFKLSTDLTSNDIDWLAWLADVYLNRLSDINNQFRLRLDTRTASFGGRYRGFLLERHLPCAAAYY